MATIANVVSTSKLSSKSLKLEEVAKKFENFYYDPKHFNAIIIKIKQPKVTGLLFSSGRLVCTGAKTICANKQAVEKIRLLLQSAGINNILSRPTEFLIQNIVCPIVSAWI